MTPGLPRRRGRPIDGPLRPPAAPEALHALASWRARFEDPDFEIGAWELSRTDENGVIQLGWFAYSPGALAFQRDVAAHGWIQPFNWGAWMASPEGTRLLEEPGGIEAATPTDLVRILTAIIRSDRFTEGSFAGAFESGLLTRIARRAEALAQQLPKELADDAGSSAANRAG